MLNLNHTRALRALALAAVVVIGAACNAPSKDGGISIKLPQKVSALSVEDAAGLRATLEIPGVLAETPLDISRDLTEATGTFDVAATTAGTHDFVLRLRWAPDESSDVLLAKLAGTIAIKPNKDNALKPVGDFDTCGAIVADGPCSLLFDLNRNGADNLTDLVAGFDPRPPPPFVDVAPGDLAFPSGIRLGTFSRQVIVVENTSAHPVEVSAQLIDAPGATLSPFETEPTTSQGAQRFLDLGTLDPFQEVLVAVSFAPVNPFLTVGDVFVEARDPASNVQQATRVRLLANVDGELQPPPLSFEPPTINEGADLGGFAGTVETFPSTSLFNGLPVSSVASADGAIAGLPFTGNTITATFTDGDAAVPADHAYLVEVPPDSKLAVSLSGLDSDVDLAVFLLDDNDNVTTDPTRNLKVGKAGTSAEAVEHDNESGTVEHALVVIGRVEVDAPPAVAGALSVDEPTPFSLSSHVTSAPEFTAPIAPAGGPLEGGTRVVLRGKRFNPAAQISFADSVALDCTFNLDTATNETVFDCTTPPGSLQIGKNPATIVVANPAQDEGGDGQAATLPEGYTYEPPAPRLDQLLPAAAPTTGSGDAVIAVKGAFFSQRNGTPVVFFEEAGAEVPLPNVHFVDSTRLEVPAPAHAAGIFAVGVRNVLDPQPGDAPGTVHLSLSSNQRNFTYVTPDQPAPTLTSMSPSTGAIDGGETVTLIGTNFLNGATVLFDGDKGTNVVVTGGSSSTITCLTPARNNAGPVDIDVINVDGQRATLAGGYTYFVPDPAVDSSFPDTSSVDGGTFLVISGTGFRAGVGVTFAKVGGGATFTSPSVNRVSTNTILAATPAVGTDNAGDYTLTVTNLDGHSATLAGAFRFLRPTGPRPRIDSLSPNAGNKDDPTVVTLTGANFRGSPDNPVILVGSQVAQVQDFEDTDTIDTVHFIAPTSSTAGPVVVRLIDDDGQSDTSVYTYFTVLGQPPVIDTLAPSTATANNTINISGRGFDVVDDGQGGTELGPNARLLVGGQLVFPTLATANSLRFLVPNLDELVDAQGAAVAIEITNGDGQSTSATFQYVPRNAAPAPVIQSVTPAIARVGATATIDGSGFDLATLRVGNIALAGDGAAVTSATATSISFTVPDPGVALPAVVVLTVQNGDGKSATTSLGIDATFVAPPVITAIQPNTVVAAGNTAVVLAGSGFSPQGVLRVGGATVANRTVTSTSVSFSAPAHAAGSAAVSFTNPDGQSASTLLGYTDEAPPPPTGTTAIIDAIAPSTSDLPGGGTVTLTGRSFDSAGVLSVAGVVVGQRTVTSTSVTFTAPARQQEGVVVVSFQNPNAPAAQTFFTYEVPFVGGGTVPAISFVNPSAVHALVPGDFVQLAGSGLATVLDVTALDASGVDAGDVQLVSTSDGSVRVRIVSALPVDENLHFAAALADGTVLESPPFAARAPRITGTFDGSGQLLIIGENLDPAALTGVVLSGGPQPVSLAVFSQSETLLVTEPLPLAPPGVTFTLNLQYVDLVTGLPLAPVEPVSAPSVSAPPLSLDTSTFGNLIPAGQDLLGLVDFVFIPSGVPFAGGSPTTFTLTDDAGGVVADGTWSFAGGGGEGGEGGTSVARLAFNGTAPLAAADFHLRLSSTASGDLADTDVNGLIAADRVVASVSPSSIRLNGVASASATAFNGDTIVLEDSASGAAVARGSIGGFCSPEQPGCLFQPSFTVDTGGLPGGDYRVCAVGPGQPLACASSPAVLTVVDPCGDGVCSGADRENPGSCPQDCPANVCGNNVCDAPIGETADTCPGDCGISFFGVQNDVPEASLVGWTECFSGAYDQSPNISQILSQCSGQNLLMACRVFGEPNYRVLAEALRDDVIFDTTNLGNQTHNANGVEWYFSDQRSWGFAPGGQTVSLSSCDLGDGFPPNSNNDRICWHTGGGNLSSGFRCGDIDANGASGVERVLYTSSFSAGPVCGDGLCQAPEDSASCAQDCPPPPGCGNGLCEPQIGEDSNNCPQDCSGGAQALRSCSEIHAQDPAAPSGLFTIDPDGAGPLGQIQATCDMTFEGGGWTLVEATNGNGPDFLTLVTPVTPFSATAMDLASESSLLQLSTEVNIRNGADASRSVTSRAGATPIQNLRNGFQSYRFAGEFRATDWTTSGDPNILNSLPMFCDSPNAQYPSFYHACGNGNGLHLLGSDSRFDFNGGQEPLEVWVRDAPIPQSCAEIFAADPGAADGEYFVGGAYQQCSKVQALGTGDGRDGSVALDGFINLESFATNGRLCPDAVSANVVGFIDPQTVTTSVALSQSCIAPGDQVLLVNEQGRPGATSNTGNFEILTVAANDGTGAIAFTKPKSKSYGDLAGDDSNLGTTDGTQRVMIQRVPQYLNVDVNGVVSPTPWDGVRGGVVAFFAAGTTHVAASGSINANASGYRGGDTNFVEVQNGQSGEGVAGKNGLGPSENFGGGGGGAGDSCAGFGVAGGGGGHLSNGGLGQSGTGCDGNGGSSYASSTKLTLGAGGGAGGDDNTLADNPPGGAGGNGGGAILVLAGNIVVDGVVTNTGVSGVGDTGLGCDGASNVDCYDFSGPGGGGAGGFIRLEGALSGSGPVVAVGGAGGLPTGPAGNGGAGGDGPVFTSGGGGGGVVAGLIHQWTFNDGTANDSVGSSPGTLNGGASISGGALFLDGVGAFVRTAPLSADSRERTLIAWVAADNLAQQAGGVLTIEDPTNGNPFDCIDFGEFTAQQWTNGSDNGFRSQGNNGGPLETSTGLRMIAITYGADQSITVFRDGAVYASTFIAGSLNTYPAGVGDVLMGVRHAALIGSGGSATGNDAFFAGVIDEASIYDRALSPAEVAQLFTAGPVPGGGA